MVLTPAIIILLFLFNRAKERARASVGKERVKSTDMGTDTGRIRGKVKVKADVKAKLTNIKRNELMVTQSCTERRWTSASPLI